MIVGPEIRLALLLLLNAAVLAAAAFAVRRWTVDAVQRWIDTLLLWFAIQYAAVCIPGVLHVLSAGTMALTALLLSGVVGYGGARVGRGEEARPPGPTLNEKRARRSSIFHPPSSLVFIAAGLFTVAVILGVIWKQMMLPMIDSDAMTYHAPAAVHWLQTGRISLLPVWFFNPANTFSPLAGSTFMAWLMAPLGGSDALARAAQAAPLFLLFLATLQVGRAVGLSPMVAALIAVAAAISRPFNSEIMAGRDDVFLAAFVAVAVAACAPAALRDRFAPIRLGLAIGLAAATKYTFLFAAPILLLLLDAPSKAGWNWRRWGGAILLALLVAGPWYLRNLLLTGNPLYPVRLAIFAHTLLPGLFAARTSERLRSLAGLKAVFIAGFHAPPIPLLIVLIFGWIAAVLAAAREARRDPLVRACLFAPPAVIALFIWKAPYAEIRFVFPSLALVFVACGLAAARWLRRLPPAAAIVAAATAGVALFTSYAATWIVVDITIPAILVTGAGTVLALADRRWGTGRARVYAAVAAALLLSGGIYVFWPAYLKGCRAARRTFWNEHYPHLAGAWQFLDEHAAPNARIAYTNTYLVYPLYGDPPARRPFYVPVRPDVTDFLHLPAFPPKPIAGEHVESTFAELLCRQPDRAAWLRRVLDSGADYLFVSRSAPIGDPPEFDFAAGDPGDFTPLFQDQGGAVFRVNPR